MNQDDKAVANNTRVMRVVRYEHDGNTAISRPCHQLQDDRRFLHPERRGRLVQDQYSRAEIESPRNRDALPLASASMDLLTYAQSWHWTEPNRSVPEALRVLRPGGALALWWNTEALDVPWIEAAARRAERFLGPDEKALRAEKSPSSARPAHSLAADPTGTLSFAHRRIRWSRSVPVDTRLANVGSHSQFLVLGEEATRAFFAEERNHLLQAFPEGFGEEPCVVELLVAIRS